MAYIPDIYAIRKAIKDLAHQDKAASTDNIKDSSFKDSLALNLRINGQTFDQWSKE